MSAKIKFNGTITAVKARIRLLRSFDQVHHAYLGYTLVMDAVVDGKDWKGCRIAVGQKTHEKHIFLKGDHISGEAVPIEHSEQEWADFYKVSGLKLISRGDASENHPADMNGGIASPLSVYRENGHLRLDPKTYESKCSLCSWGLVMATEIILDHWNPSRKKWRFETHCYGPRDCSNYRPGKPRTVQGRKPGMVWIDDDFERARSGDY
ncbi:MAG TPA: hypothetical protein DD713_05810 [Nitrospiraceae bacterium]|nr:hypothetical protein [Nitrospiraceae bacterium]